MGLKPGCAADKLPSGVTGCLGSLAASAYIGASLLVVALGLILPAALGLPSVLGVVAWLLTAGAGGGVVAITVAFAAERLALVEM